jgi:hypothetical protein
MSFCEICNTTECDLCNAPMPTLERQTNQVGPREDYLVDEHEECDDEPCASCLERWECDLEALKSLDEIDGLTAYHIARHEKMVEAGKLRQRKVAAFEAARAAFEAEARQAYLAARARYAPEDEPFRHVFRGVHIFPPEMPQIQLLERQTNDHPINFQAPRPRCLVKNCSCEESGTFPRLVKEVNGELVHY